MDDKHLARLARLCGVQTAYRDADGALTEAEPRLLANVLRSRGALPDGVGAAEALRRRRRELWGRILEPAIVIWDAVAAAAADLRLPASAGGRFRCQLELEDGRRLGHEGKLAACPVVKSRRVEGDLYCVRRLSLPWDLPCGYHRLQVELPWAAVDSLLLAAPARAYAGPDGDARRWGVFMPLYALHRKTSWGAGDLGDLQALVDWTADRGGSAVETLPLLASLWELAAGPSPYEPATRLFWNEIYLDVEGIEHLAACDEARELVAQARAAGRVETLRKTPLVDHAAIMAFKRPILEALSRWCWAGRARHQLQMHLHDNPRARLFAQFRAVGEKQRAHWPHWPEALRQGYIAAGDFDPAVKRYHAYCQWQLDHQMRRLADAAAARGVALCLDYPLGVTRVGFDAWNEQGLFVDGVSLGAPPDPLFSKGQNWGFAPICPDAQRQTHYRYFRQAVAAHLRYAGMLRIDHVMGLYRQYWIPHGASARQGLYVRYPCDELMAVLTIESNRHKAVIIGENLGTVPAAVNKQMHAHRLHGLFVLPFAIDPSASPPVGSPPRDSVAMLNTHDMATFAGFWKATDIRLWQQLDLIDAALAAAMRRDRYDARRALVETLQAEHLLDAHVLLPQLIEAALAYLASTDARFLRINLEDLWCEPRAQNVPGTVNEHPNWRRRAGYSFEDWSTSPQVARIIGRVDQLRRQRMR
ncbi:MAG: 4-alpha-glucanotransferase [Planctomycetaceae bacterium]|nr:4-alpha-glucanotransferase [Planctomycetaceae bacterium]